MRPEGPCPARIMIVGEAPGEQDIVKGMPFQGYPGQELSAMLHDAGIMRSECFITHVCFDRPVANDIGRFVAMRKKDITERHVRLRDRWVTPEVIHGVERLRREVQLCRPNVIIALGNLALWSLTGEWGVANWRGSVIASDEVFGVPVKVVCGVSPAVIMRQWTARNFLVADLRRAKKESAYPEVRAPEFRFQLRPTLESALATIASLFVRVQDAPTWLSVDIETRAGHTACIGIAWSPLDAICIPLMCVEDREGYWSLESETLIQMALLDLLTHPNAKIVGQNFIYDLQYFHRHHFYMPRLVHDTMLSQHVMFPNLDKGLDVLSSLHCEHHAYWKGEGKDWDASMPEEQLWNYNCEDACRTYEVAMSQIAAIEAMGLKEVHTFQQALVWPVVESMNRGIRIDTVRKAEIIYELGLQSAERQKKIQYLLGHDINLGSPVQLKHLFYEQCRVKPVMDRKTKQPTTNDEALRTIAKREPILAGVCQTIAEYRSLNVFRATFAEAPLDVDGRMRCSFNIGGTETFRFSSSKNAFGSGLNFQNIPKGDESEGAILNLPNMRSLFLPDPGYEFFDIDLSSADLRIVVWEADEPEMKAMLAAGLDPYTEIAKEFYQDPFITKKDSRRQTFKAFAHGTNYLGTAKGLAERLGISIYQAEKTQDWYFRRFPRIKEWQDNLKQTVTTKRQIQNVFGYRLHIFDRIEGTIFNQCAAWVPQSTVACLINRVYMNIYNNLKEVQVLLQVHDSLAGQYPADRSAHWQEAILEQAQVVLPYADPCIIPVGIKVSAKSWGDCD